MQCCVGQCPQGGACSTKLWVDTIQATTLPWCSLQSRHGTSCAFWRLIAGAEKDVHAPGAPGEAGRAPTWLFSMMNSMGVLAREAMLYACRAACCQRQGSVGLTGGQAQRCADCANRCLPLTMTACSSISGLADQLAGRGCVWPRMISSIHCTMLRIPAAQRPACCSGARGGSVRGLFGMLSPRTQGSMLRTSCTCPWLAAPSP